MEIQVLYLTTGIYVISKVKHQGPLVFLKDPQQIQQTFHEDGTISIKLIPFLPFSLSEQSYGFAIHRDHILHYGRPTTDIANQYASLGT
jgi:hypothetical protein